MFLPKDEKERLFRAALVEFNRLPLKFNYDTYPFIPAIALQRCDEMRAVTFPVQQFFGMTSQKGFLANIRM